MSNRLESLDWLRGLMALSIMLYHFTGHHDAATPLGRLGVYGVSIFFVLSGLSMAIVYDRYIIDLRTSFLFFVRRIFRIWPLLWLAILLVTIPAYVSSQGNFSDGPYSLENVGLNLTTLFGFVAPANYINMGAWSIGNEMVYYTLTPVYVVAHHFRKSLGNLLAFASAGIGIVFSSYLLSPADTLDAQWNTYINPLNNLFLYFSGLALYYNFRDVKISSKLHTGIFFAPIVLFFVFPGSGDQINLVTGVNRLAMATISIGIVFVFYKCPPVLPKMVGLRFEQLGIATYGVYLLHPIVLRFIQDLLLILGFHSKHIAAPIAIPVTFILSLLTYRYIEGPFIRWGKHLTTPRPPNLDKPESPSSRRGT